jgi:molecular chaperone HtpG
MVAKQVELTTLSYQDGAEAVRWTCEGSTNFSLESCDRPERGTTVTLTLQDEEQEYLEAERIKQLVKTYCDFMPVPIKLDNEQINKQKAPWKESPSSLSNDDYLELYRYLYPFQEDPLLWVHINTDYPFLVNGILYFPKIKPDIDVTKGQIKLYCNQVFVSDHCEEVVPQFLLPLRGVIDSTDIPLNVSRSFLQADRTVRKIAEHIAKKVGDRLKLLYHDNRANYIQSWQDLGTFVKFGSINDDKFRSQVEDIVIFRTTADLKPEAGEGDDAWAESGDAYTNIKEYLERNRDRHENKVYYCTDEVNQSTYVELHRNQGIEVLFMDTFIDTHFVPFLEREYSDVKFLRVDSELDETLIDANKEAEIVDPNTNQTRSDQIKSLFETALNKPKITIRTESLKSEGAPPAMVLLPESSRRLQEMMAMMQQQAVQFPEDHVLLVNTSHPMIQNLINLNQGAIVSGTGESPSAQLAKQICEYVYDLALMAQKGFDAEGMKTFSERSNKMLTKLTELATR